MRTSLRGTVVGAFVAAWFIAPGIGWGQLIPGPGSEPAPTVVLSTDHGAPGDRVTVSGVAAGGAPGSVVLVQWLVGQATEPTVEATLGGAGLRPGAELRCAEGGRTGDVSDPARPLNARRRLLDIDAQRSCREGARAPVQI